MKKLANDDEFLSQQLSIEDSSDESDLMQKIADQLKEMVHGKNTPKRRNESGKFEKENTFDSDDEENERL